MKFPFVTRGVYQDVLELLQSERVRTDSLMATIVGLKVNGATLPRTAEPRAPRIPTEYEFAIDQNRHANRPGVRSALLRFVDNAVASNTPHDEIMNRLQNWSTVAPADRQPADPDDDDEGIIALQVGD